MVENKENPRDRRNEANKKDEPERGTQAIQSQPGREDTSTKIGSKDVAQATVEADTEKEDE